MLLSLSKNGFSVPKRISELGISTNSEFSPSRMHQFNPFGQFDWRLRAPSRRRNFNAPFQKKKKYTLRKFPTLVRVEEGERYYGSIQAYQHRFFQLLEAEQAEDEAILQERLSNWSIARLKEEGYCLTGLSAYWLQENRFGRPIASFLLGPGLTLPENRFENGTQILVSRIDPLQEQPVKGSVVSSSSSHVRVSFAEQFDIDDGVWRLDVGRSNIMYERMRHAITCFDYDLEQQEMLSVTSDFQPILQGTCLRDILLRTFEPTAVPHAHVPVQAPNEVSYPPSTILDHAYKVQGPHGNQGAFRNDMRIQSWAKRYAELQPVIVEGDPELEGLNSTQRRAVATMIGQRISLVQGPPGTGKTKTIIEAVRLLKVHFEVPHPILVCTYTNVAVDNLVDGLAVSGLKPLRVGSGSNARSSVSMYTLDHRLSIHPLRQTLVKITKEERELGRRITDLIGRLNNIHEKRLSGDARAIAKGESMQKALAAMRMEITSMRTRKYGIEQRMIREIIHDSDVICTTCITSASVSLNHTDFPIVFLDEASMSTEPASLIPIMKGSQHVALIGDHKQLPPVISSRDAQDMGLGISLFERLTEEGVVPSIMLDVQYRMHPTISRFPSLEFYNLNLRDGTVDSGGTVQPWLQPPASQHLKEDSLTGNRPSVIFLDHAGAESIKDRSRVNHSEARIVASVVEDLLLNNPQLGGRDIGIIAPYAAQISLLKRLFRGDPKYQTRFKGILGSHRVMQLDHIEINTVDGFEGREKDVILFSTVRNNPGGYIGFLADRRRLNVGLTRAKRGLFVIGNINTLKIGRTSSKHSDPTMASTWKGAESWRRYAQFLREQGLVLKLEGEALVQALYGNMKATQASKGTPSTTVK